MRANSIIMLVLALVFGVIAVFLVQSWLQGQVSVAGKQPAAAPEPTETIVVAARPLRFGAVLKPDALKEIPWPGGARPSGSFSKVSELLTDEGERAVLSAIEINEPVLTKKITGPGARATLSAVVDKGMRAVSISVNARVGVSGFVLPGDRVDVFLTRNVQGAGRVTDIFMQNVKVLAIDQIADDRKNDAKVSSTVTFEVDTFDAQKLALAQGLGTLSLALRSAGSIDAAQPRRVTLGDLNPAAEIYSEEGQDGGAPKIPAAIDERFKAVENQIKSVSDLILQANKRKIGGEDGLNKPTVPIADPNARVGIIRGIQLQEYSVPRDDAR